MRSLVEVAHTLERMMRSEVARKMVETRLILRTGIDLRQPRPEQLHCKQTIATILRELERMGITLPQEVRP